MLLSWGGGGGFKKGQLVSTICSHFLFIERAEKSRWGGKLERSATLFKVIVPFKRRLI